MQQLTQLLKDGTMQIREVPFPALLPGHVLVRNHFSVISAGTEGKTVKDARLGYIGKARARKQEVKKVMDAIRTYGIRDTYRMVMNKLETPSPLGYSSAGQIIALASDVQDFKTGDRVACAGSSACHSEVISVPVNLCVKLKEEVALDEAAFTTIGAIAMQGIRQSDLRLGENSVVIGLGLIGQLTMQLLKAGGVHVVGIDVSEKAVTDTNRLFPGSAFSRNNPGLENSILQFTNGYGADAIIITAATNSTDPVDLAGQLARKKGKVVIVGAVPTGFERKNYYIKELDLRMSSSYGPGRYDSEYEEKGIDYPYSYVRWTENRNMQSFAELLAQKKIDIKSLITHRYPFEQAQNAYQLILDNNEWFRGIVLEYDVKKELNKNIELTDHIPVQSKVKAGLIGAGSFGQNFMLPSLKGQVQFEAVATARSNNAINIASRFGFAMATGNADEVINNEMVNTIFIATRHNTHAEYVIKALEKDKHVFTEKPLCLNEHELEIIKNTYAGSKALLMLGFNRRFAPIMEQIKNTFINSTPVSILYRINAGIVPSDHWVHDPETGGGRIIGEVCHFIDLCCFISESRVTHLSATAMEDPHNLHDTLTINLQFANGSIATIAYFSNGNKNLNKEYLEVFGYGNVAVLDDFRELTIYGKSKTHVKTTQDKGHKATITRFIKSIENGEPAPLSFDAIYHSTLVTFKVIESIRTNGASIQIDLP